MIRSTATSLRHSALATGTLLVVLLNVGSAPPALAAEPAVDEIVGRFLDADPWGFGGTILNGRAILMDKAGATSELGFSARSRRYSPPFSKTLVRFTAPADVAGSGFLQIQKREGDDERFLFLPELKRSRRISGNLRRSSFMGTDFSFADIDRRDFRESSSVAKADESVGSFRCFHLDSKPTRSDSAYSHIETWLRTDNYLPLKMQMYDRANVLLKTFTALEVRRVKGHWYVTKSLMVDHVQSHETKLVIDSIEPSDDISDDEFTVRNLEKL
jgi:outer membrane lipoprotein-sorting protein